MGALPHLKNFWNAGTRPPSRSGLRPTRPPWLILLPRNIICFTFTPSQVSYSWKKSYLKRSHSLCPLRAQWLSPFFLLTELLLRTVHIKHYYGFIWNLPCPAATPTFFTSLVFQQQDHMRFPFRYCLNFENTDLIFFCRFSQNKLITSFEFKKNSEKQLKIARHYCDCRLYLFSLLEVNDAP